MVYTSSIPSDWSTHLLLTELWPVIIYICIYTHTHTYTHTQTSLYYIYTHTHIHTHIHTWCPGRNAKNFGRVFLMLKYTDITQNTYIQIWTVTEIKAREKCVQLRVSTHYLPADHLMHAHPSVRYRITPYPISKLHTFMLIMKYSLRIRCEWLVTFRVMSALCDSYSVYSVWNPTDNYSIIASVFVVQFNGFMSLIC
jgi:hypothetical protein